MKKTMIYSITFFLAFFSAGISKTFAIKGEPRIKYKRVVVHKPMKGLVVYHRPAVVRSGYVWVDGHYQWNKRAQAYLWVSGRYLKQKPGRVWVNGRWKQVRGGWTYQPGSWRSQSRF